MVINFKNSVNQKFFVWSICVTGINCKCALPAVLNDVAWAQDEPIGELDQVEHAGLGSLF
jgi:hypothetical protein